MIIYKIKQMYINEPISTILSLSVCVLAFLGIILGFLGI